MRGKLKALEHMKTHITVIDQENVLFSSTCPSFPKKKHALIWLHQNPKRKSSRNTVAKVLPKSMAKAFSHSTLACFNAPWKKKKNQPNKKPKHSTKPTNYQGGQSHCSRFDDSLRGCVIFYNLCSCWIRFLELLPDCEADSMGWRSFI